MFDFLVVLSTTSIRDFALTVATAAEAAAAMAACCCGSNSSMGRLDRNSTTQNQIGRTSLTAGFFLPMQYFFSMCSYSSLFLLVPLLRDQFKDPDRKRGKSKLNWGVFAQLVAIH